MGKPEIRWLNSPRDTNYPAAQSYLTLCFPEKQAKALVKKLKTAPMTVFKAKDIFRASRLTLLSLKNKHVEADLAKIEKGEELSPIMLVRDPLSNRVIIADGFHRLSAVYSISEDADIPCKII